jgi:hypothetical protein
MPPSEAIGFALVERLARRMRRIIIYYFHQIQLRRPVYLPTLVA